METELHIHLRELWTKAVLGRNLSALWNLVKHDTQYVVKRAMRSSLLVFKRRAPHFVQGSLQDISYRGVRPAWPVRGSPPRRDNDPCELAPRAAGSSSKCSLYERYTSIPRTPTPHHSERFVPRKLSGAARGSVAPVQPQGTRGCGVGVLGRNDT